MNLTCIQLKFPTDSLMKAKKLVHVIETKKETLLCKIHNSGKRLKLCLWDY